MITIGLAVASFVHRDDMTPGEDFMVVLGGGIAVTALAAIVQFPLPLAFTAVSPPLMILIFAASFLTAWSRRQWVLTLAKDAQVRLMAAAIAAMFVVGLAVGALPWDKPPPITGGSGSVWSFHVPNMPGDSILQYRAAEILQNRLPIQTTEFYVNYWYISDRTPLIGFVTTFLTSSVGISLPADLNQLVAPYQVVDPFGYWLYRQISMFTNAMIVASALLVAWELLGARVARLGAVLILLSPYILISILFHWPKSLVGFFVVGFYFWSHIRRRPILAGVFAAGAILSHPIAAIYLPGMYLYLFVARRWRQLLASGLVAAALASPWFLWTSLYYHHTSRLLTYPLGYALADPTNPGPEIRNDLQAFLSRPIASILKDRWDTIVQTFTTWPFPQQLLENGMRHLKNEVYEVYRTTFPGIFGAGLAAFGYASWKRIVSQPFWLATLGASTIGLFLWWGIAPRAITQEGFQPGAALWICLASAVLIGLPSWVIRFVLLVSALEWIPFTYFLVLQTPPLASWHLSWLLLVLLSLLVIAGVTVVGWRIASEPGETPIAAAKTERPELAASSVS